MSSDTEPPPSGQASAAVAAIVDMDIVHNENIDSSYTNGIPHNTVEVPSTPLGPDVIPASQETILSTEGPGSPMDADMSFRTELNDDDDIDVDADTDLPPIIPSSLTPPPQPQHFQRQQPLLPPPSSGYVHTSASQRSAILSPPGTGLNSVTQARRDAAAVAASSSSHAAASAFPGPPAEFTPPTHAQIADATPDELRAMLQASLAEHTRLKTETAHHRLQHNLLAMQADEDAKRAAAEHEMTRREAEALRLAESARQARRELSTAAESSQIKYRQLKAWYDEAMAENETLQKRVKLAKRVIQQKDDEVAGLVDEKELLLNRLRENREHFHLLCSPGGLFHGAMTPKPQALGSPAAHARATPYQTPKRGGSGGRAAHGTTSAAAASATTPHGGTAEPFAALLQALNQENNSAPNTPMAGHRAAPRHVAKHMRNAQSMSSLPTTPTSRPRGGEYAGLLPSVDLVPQTEPPPLRYSGPTGRSGHGHGHSQSLSTSASGRYFPETPTRVRHRLPGHLEERGTTGRRSRESTISADEEAANATAGAAASAGASGTNEDLARQALESVAARATQTASSSFSRLSSASSQSFSASRHTPLDRSATADERVFESPASQVASAMLRRDPRDNFEVAASREASRDGTPASATTTATTAEKSAKLQAKLFGGLNKSGSGAGTVDKRKFSGVQGGHSAGHGSHSDAVAASAAAADGLRHGSDAHPLQASPTKKVRIVPSLRDNGDSYRHHHSYQQPQQQQQQQQQQRQQEHDRVGLGIRYD